MATKSHRLFIGNIPAGTNDRELSKEFSAYGTVESIEIKTKVNPINDAVDTFGFVTLNTLDHVVSLCISEFKQQAYKGVYLNVSRAKESFLDKLKREREEAEAQKKNAQLQAPAKPEEQKKPKETLPTLPTLGTGRDESSSESSDSEQEADEPAIQKRPGPQYETSRKPQTPKVEDELVQKWNQETYLEYGKLKIVPITGQVAEVIDRSKPHQNRSDKKLGGKARIADEKRKEGLNKLKSTYEQQKLAIKSALAGEAVNSKNKIKFNDDESEGKSKLSLFDGPEDDDDFEGNFTVRKQMVGEEGQKLYELQTSFQADSRFRLDARFLEDSDKAKVRSTPQSKASDKERKKQLEILSNVTGKPIITEKRTENKNNPQMQRFDPLQQTDKPSKPEPEVRKLSEIKRAERPESDFKVSDEKYFNVSGSFAVAAENKAPTQGFSLLALYGTAPKVNENDNEADQAYSSDHEEKPLKTNARFRYDSSDSEDEKAEKKQKKKKQDIEDAKAGGKQNGKVDHKTSDANVEKHSSGYYSKQGIWKEHFFFLPNDARFEAGREFLGLVPGKDGTDRADEQAGLTVTEIQDIHKLYKKRRYREVRRAQKESKLGLRRVKRKSVVTAKWRKKAKV